MGEVRFILKQAKQRISKRERRPNRGFDAAAARRANYTCVGRPNGATIAATIRNPENVGPRWPEGYIFNRQPPETWACPISLLRIFSAGRGGDVTARSMSCRKALLPEKAQALGDPND
jgi:hypothetical protein